MLRIVTCSGSAPAASLAGLTGDDLVLPRLNRMKMRFHRLAAVSAAREGIQPSASMYALWARLEDGSILGLRRVGEIWQLTRMTLPSAAVAELNLPSLVQARNDLHWVELTNWRLQAAPLLDLPTIQSELHAKRLGFPGLAVGL